MVAARPRSESTVFSQGRWVMVSMGTQITVPASIKLASAKKTNADAPGTKASPKIERKARGNRIKARKRGRLLFHQQLKKPETLEKVVPDLVHDFYHRGPS